MTTESTSSTSLAPIGEVSLPPVIKQVTVQGSNDELFMELRMLRNRFATIEAHIKARDYTQEHGRWGYLLQNIQTQIAQIMGEMMM